MGVEKNIEILAKSSSSDTPYTVRCYFEENKISFFCSCPAGDNRKLCKHVRQIIAGDDSILYDINQKKELEEINNSLQKTQIPLLLLEISKSEYLLEETKRNIKKAKKKLENVILNKLKQ
ncbi:MAG: hypothetical protein ISS77_01960 [Phycisphaerae bacterium]|nr:hypothetical protein [Phycisphaerae bacterium]